MLKGNPFTFPEVKTLLGGVTVGGRKISDQEQVLNLAESSKRLRAIIKGGEFSLSQPAFTELNGISRTQGSFGVECVPWKRSGKELHP